MSKTRLLASLAVALAASGLSLNVATAQTTDQVSDIKAAPRLTTPTVAERDALWEKAVAKYTPERNRLLKRASDVNAQGRFKPDWNSLKQYQTPEWYADAKFGIFIHWGLYSIPANSGEWYSRYMYEKNHPAFQHHVKTWGPQKSFGYKDFIPLFKAENYRPAEWAALFKQAGAKYVIPVAEHHDGFSLFDSHLSDWTSVKMGPKRDIIAELKASVKKEGLKFGVSSHRAENNWFFDAGYEFYSDVGDPAAAGLYGPAQARLLGKDDADLFGDYTPVSQAFLDDWLARQIEIEDRYQPDILYFDWWIGQPSFRKTLPKFLAYYYNHEKARGNDGVINYKLGEFADGTGVLDIERGQASAIRKDVWQTCTSISARSWGYIEGDTYKSPANLIHLLSDVVSKNGNLLLNIGPKADGSIPSEARDILVTMGTWLDMNGEAIYGSRPWTIFGEGPTETASGSFQETSTRPYTPEDFRFTTRDGNLYAIQMAAPVGSNVTIRSIRPDYKVRSVTLLGGNMPLSFQQTSEGLVIQTPVEIPQIGKDLKSVVYRIES